jgi:hypothetical protein
MEKQVVDNKVVQKKSLIRADAAQKLMAFASLIVLIIVFSIASLLSGA